MAAKKETSIDILTLNTASLTANIVGVTPFICHSMNAKVMSDLLLPPAKKNKSQRESTLKHDPLAEYRRSPYRFKGDEAPTRIFHPAGAWKKAVAQAAVDIPGAAKAQIGRLCWIEGRDIPLWGIPQMLMSVTRSADMNRTPDVRTRAILPEWATTVTITFVQPNLKQVAVANLLAAAGLINGMGDWRTQKGSGNFGQFRLVDANDPDFLRIVKQGGREAQDVALENPTCFDLESEELFEWFNAEVARRGFKTA